LTDTEGRARAGILRLNRFLGGVAYETKPIHAINTNSRYPDSYEGLSSILKQGFISSCEGDLNASILTEDIPSSLISLASGKKELMFGDSSCNSETKDDRYFLEFKRFSSLNWDKQKPSNWGGMCMYISIDSVKTPDIHVNVVLGTQDPTEIQKRMQMYQELFRQHGVTSRYIARTGIIEARG
jgi:hypothetical protein